MSTKPKENISVDEETQFIINQLYKAAPTTMVMPDGQTTEVPDAGNLGLLAYGFHGILAWRKKREEVYGKRLYSPINELIKLISKSIDDTKINSGGVPG